MSVSPPIARCVLLPAIFALGVSAIVTQLVLMREMMTVFSGNEMVLGVVLGGWLLLMGLGCSIGRLADRLRRPEAVLAATQAVLAIMPIAQIVALRTLRDAVFIRGAALGVTETVLSALVLLAPYCVPAGFALTLASRLLGRHLGGAGAADFRGIGLSYFLDNVGSVAGGLLFSFVLIRWFGHFVSLYVPAFVNLFFAVALARSAGRRIIAWAACCALAALAALACTIDLDTWSTQMQYPQRDVVFAGDSPYGRLVVARSGGQYDFIENGLPLFSTHDYEQVEETVHYAMAQRPSARRVLLACGGVSGTAREILKYRSATVDYVDLDPLIVELGRRLTPASLDDPRISVHLGDARPFVAHARDRYDVIIVDAPAPATAQLNRYYTAEFFDQAKAALAPGGVLAVSFEPYDGYVSKKLGRQLATVRATLRTAFDNVLIVPGGRIFFLACDGELTADVWPRMKEAGIEVRRLDEGYLAATLSPDRLADVRRAAAWDAPVNRDFAPVLYYYHQLQWLSQFNYGVGVAEAIAILAALVYVVRLRPAGVAIFTVGFCASAVEMVLLLGFQVLYGSVYHKLGLIVTAFMAGLAAGSYAAGRLAPRLGRRGLVWIEMLLSAFAASMPLILGALAAAGAGGALAQAAFPALAAVLATMVGLTFPVAANVDFQGLAVTAGRLYAADFIGACLGAMLVSTVLIPVIGVAGVCLACAAMCMIGGFVVRWK